MHFHVEVEALSRRERSGSLLAKSRAFFARDLGISVNRLSIALVCYAVLGALAWTTLTDPKFRAGTLLILALFAVKSVLRRNDVLHPDEEKPSEPEKASVKVAES